MTTKANQTMSSSHYLVEERVAVMVSPGSDGHPITRTAHFLKPSGDDSAATDPPPLACSLSTEIPISSLMDMVSFKERIYSALNWKKWVDKLRPRFQSLWKSAGIDEPISCSLRKIARDKKLLFTVAERWSPQTNTFFFPFGEATVTLEDVAVLGGYSVSGDSVSSPLETVEMLRAEEKLIQALKSYPMQNSWMERFMNASDEPSELEHEAFLSLWLLRSVFPPARNGSVTKHVFPIAVRLSRGIRLALAPAVLASIYRDLGRLKVVMVALRKVERIRGGNSETSTDCSWPLSIPIQSPLQMLQIWIWERFPDLQPQPAPVESGQPRLAQWHMVKNLKVDARSLIDIAGDSFRWRPYGMVVRNPTPQKNCAYEGKWVVVDSNSDMELLSFALCLRVSMLVGLDCEQPYYPHRVAMQFGFDQDVPGDVNVSSPKFSWDREIKGSEIYIPHRQFKSNVTERYLKLWKGGFVQALTDPLRTCRRSKRSSRKITSLAERLGGNKEGQAKVVSECPGLITPTAPMVMRDCSVDEDKLTITELLRYCEKKKLSSPKEIVEQEDNSREMDKHQTIPTSLNPNKMGSAMDKHTTSKTFVSEGELKGLSSSMGESKSGNRKVGDKHSQHLIPNDSSSSMGESKIGVGGEIFIIKAEGLDDFLRTNGNAEENFDFEMEARVRKLECKTAAFKAILAKRLEKYVP